MSWRTSAACTSHPKIGSFCSGIAGLDMAAHAVFGGSLAWQAEIDPDACAVLARQFPGVLNIGSVKRESWDDAEQPNCPTSEDARSSTRQCGEYAIRMLAA